ncbi:helicase-related protein, partial [Bacillus sp. EB01]|uniref:helicase-related protein n=1 Tax=Bacillus sp. EB01 TaxID=1347086 RepID=UPI0005C65B8F
PADTVSQLAIQTTDRGKQGALMDLVNTHRPFMAVVFCRTKRRVGRLYEVLKSNKFSCDELHGDLSQAKREQVMKRFRNSEFQLLIATDVAARGLDVEGVTHVFNYDIPEDAESYVHRIGRTGRAGTKGLAITLYTDADSQLLRSIEKELNIRIKKQELESGKKDDSSKKDDRPRGQADKKKSDRPEKPKRGGKSNGPGRSSSPEQHRSNRGKQNKEKPPGRGRSTNKASVKGKRR